MDKPAPHGLTQPTVFSDLTRAASNGGPCAFLAWHLAIAYRFLWQSASGSSSPKRTDWGDRVGHCLAFHPAGEEWRAL